MTSRDDDEVSLEQTRRIFESMGYDPAAISQEMLDAASRKRRLHSRRETAVDMFDGTLLTLEAMPGEDALAIGLRDRTGNELSAAVKWRDLMRILRRIR